MAKSPPSTPRSIEALQQVMADLRSPDGGCPWDLEQDYRSIAPYTLEEAYEVADAIERGNMDDLQEELGDLLLQVIFHAQMAEEEGRFTFADVVEGIVTKMVRRHPHVYDNQHRANAGEVLKAWDQIKAEEKANKSKSHDRLLDDVPVNHTALTRAVKLQKKAAKVGFDWPDISQVMDKLREEANELVEARDALGQDKVEEEFGDLVFVVANLGRHLKVDPEAALRRTNHKFYTRFAFVEDSVKASGKNWQHFTLEELEEFWQQAKTKA